MLPDVMYHHSVLYYHRMNQITRPPDNAVHPLSGISRSRSHYLLYMHDPIDM